MDFVKEYRTTRLTRDGREPAVDPVMVEESLELFVNGKSLSSIVTTTDLHKELAVGYMVTEGCIKERADLEGVEEEGRKVFLKVRSFEHFNLWHELRSSGCIGINWDRKDLVTEIPVTCTFSVDVLLDSIQYLYDQTQDATGGAHTASLVDATGKLRYKALDIGRHNAVDKVVGMAFLSGEDLSSLFLVSSGRQPAGMVMKAVRAGIPLVITKAAPISSGVDAALLYNLTLCCYATREKFKVFSAIDRIR